MAPPAIGRSGFSRRAQYSTFFSYAIGVTGAVIGLALLIVSTFSPDAFSGLRGVAADAAQPAASATAAGRSTGQGLIDSVTGFFKMGSRHAKLERELAEAKVRLVEAQATENENARLRKLLTLEKRSPAPVASARMTASTSASARRFATISAGRNKGIAKGMPVRSPRGLIGRVLEVGARSARVLLITDTESLVPVRRATDGIPAFASGQGDGTIRIRLINLGINPLKQNDVLVTSGSGGLYRPGTPMAIVTKLLADGAIARVLANPTDTNYVLIEESWAPEPPPAPGENDEEGNGTSSAAGEEA